VSSHEPTLARECRVFTRWLTGLGANDHVIGKYSVAHGSNEALTAHDRFDRLLLHLARMHRLTARLVDSYSALLRPRGVLRKKLVLLLAILETCPPYCDAIEQVRPRPLPWVLIALTLRGLLAVIVTIVAVAILLPLQLVLALFPGKGR